MKKASKISGIILFIAIIALGIYYVVREPAQTIPTYTSSVNTDNWQSYTNEKYGFSFKYPTDWQIYTKDNPDNSVIIVEVGDKNYPTQKPIANVFIVRTLEDLDRAYVLEGTFKADAGWNFNNNVVTASSTGSRFERFIYDDTHDINIIMTALTSAEQTLLEGILSTLVWSK